MIFFDFEYNETMVLICAVKKGGYGHIFDCRDTAEVQELSDFIKENENEIFASYALSAEIESLLRLEIPVDNMKCIDLMAESRMITMSHDKYFTADGSMLGQLRAILKVDVKEDKEHKEKMRELILSRNKWTPEEWDEICLYCWSDIEPLEELFNRIVEIHNENNHTLDPRHALSRGEFVRMTTEMDFVSKGFPVWGGDIEKIYGNKDKVKTTLIKSLPYYWQTCFEKKKTGGYTLKRKSVIDLAKARGWWEQWRKTETGMPVLEADYLKELSLHVPEVHALYTVQRSLTTLNSADLRSQVIDGYVRTKTFAFAAKTGRNGLKPKHGFLMNLPSWMRKMIHPHPGMVLVGVDWSQQEIAIAAALSGDEKLIAAYESGDVYLTLGKMAGHIPESGTKQTHKKERDLFKALQLALGYGKGVNSLGLDFYAIMREDGVSLTDAKIKAKEIYLWHKSYFNAYWDWINKEVTNARLRGWIETSDGWVEWVSKRTLTTQLMNFPSQATGATMMRECTKVFYKAWKEGSLPPVLCSQHDAFWFTLVHSSHTFEMLGIEQLMASVSRDLIGLEVRSGTKVFTNEQSYVPESWNSQNQALWESAVSFR